ncbi:MAG: ribonuclease III [Pseudomonadales bacterium]
MSDSSTRRAPLFARVGHTFDDSALLQQALTHRSYGSNNNERLEFLGDSILNYIITQQLFTQFPELREGDLSRMRASLVKGVTLAELARELRLGDHLLLGSGELKSGGRKRDSILADAFEALVGALYLDAGFATTEAFLLREYASRLAKLDLQAVDKDPKTQLQEILQSRQLSLPTYRVVAESGAAHAVHFVVACEICLLPNAAQGEGSSRREAEQNAAHMALELLGHE